MLITGTVMSMLTPSSPKSLSLNILRCGDKKSCRRNKTIWWAAYQTISQINICTFRFKKVWACFIAAVLKFLSRRKSFQAACCEPINVFYQPWIISGKLLAKQVSFKIIKSMNCSARFSSPTQVSIIQMKKSKRSPKLPELHVVLLSEHIVRL